MTQEEDRQDGPEQRRWTRKRLGVVLGVVALLLAVLLVPPMISISRYKSQITSIVSQSLGRPVRLSSVELRLVPRPGFVLTDLTVEGDPAYDEEPVLHANSVTAAIRLFSLWRGKLEISRISVDEASLNLVHTVDGRWNLDPIFRTATGHAGTIPAANAAHTLPYLEATNSRVNIKNGLEKLPFSLVDADVSFWQADSNSWQLRLRGQPARTDVSLALADTGIMRLEATLHRAPELHQMPVHVDMEWREAQLGQLSRLVIGSDPGWRGDLTGQLQLDGTAASAVVKTRLKATGVHRTEFAPVDALDFDANCSFVLHYSSRSVENLACDSPLGQGHVKLAGDLPAQGPGKLAVDAQRVPVSAGLDVLRTLRSGIADDLEARGTMSGQLTYDPAAAEKAAEAARDEHHRPVRKAAAKTAPAVPGALQGSLTIDGFQLSGGGLRQPIQIAKIAFAPAATEDGQSEALAASIVLPAGGPEPLAVTVRLKSSGYQLGAIGPVAFPRLRELAGVIGAPGAAGLEAFAGDPAVLDLSAQGPWLPSANVPQNSIELAGSTQESDLLSAGAAPDQLSGTVTLHNANWRSAVLTNAVEIPEATLHLGNNTLLWDPVTFSYGPVKGTASLRLPVSCAVGESCPPQLDLHFDKLNTAELQAALLGARQPGTMLSTLLERFTRNTPPVWPRLNGTLKADVLVLGSASGSVTLEKASISFRVLPASAEFSSLDAGLFGGQLHATGTVTSGDKPTYSFDGGFQKATGPALCQLFKLHCTVGSVDGSGKLTLTGFSADDLAASAAGSLHFEWHHGAISAPAVPRALARFTRWTGDASIGQGAMTLKQAQVQQGLRTDAVDASITLTDPPKIAFPSEKPAEPEHR